MINVGELKKYTIQYIINNLNVNFNFTIRLFLVISSLVLLDYLRRRFLIFCSNYIKHIEYYYFLKESIYKFNEECENFRFHYETYELYEDFFSSLPTYTPHQNLDFDDNIANVLSSTKYRNILERLLFTNSAINRLFLTKSKSRSIVKFTNWDISAMSLIVADNLYFVSMYSVNLKIDLQCSHYEYLQFKGEVEKKVCKDKE